MKKRSFTLIELLVVIAIIAILAAILLPSLQAARERGKSTTCMNNVKTISSAFVFYLDDYKGSYPFYANQVSGANWTRWPSIFTIKCKYISENANYLCPSNPGKPGNYWYDLLKKNAHPADQTNAMWTYIDYGYNKNYIGGAGTDPEDTLPARVGQIRNPAATIILGEASTYKDLNQSKLGYYTIMPGYWEQGLLRTRHNCALVIMWADGHVTMEAVSNDDNPYEDSIFSNRTKKSVDCLWDRY